MKKIISKFASLALSIALITFNPSATTDDHVKIMKGNEMQCIIDNIASGELDHKYWIEQMKTVENVSNEDLTWLARNIYFEARGENLHGRMAVAFVTLNRVTTSRRWPHTIKGVVTQKWQFSWYNKRVVPLINNKKLWDRAVKTARLSLELYNDMVDATNFRYDGLVYGADHYFADYIKMPSWARNMKYKTTIGHHIFYKDL